MNYSSINDNTSTILSNHSFLANDSHYLKHVKKHPERDMQDYVRIIDQGQDEELSCSSVGKFSSLVDDSDMLPFKNSP